MLLKIKDCFKLKSFIKGQNIYSEGEEAEFIYIIRSGEFKVTLVSVMIDLLMKVIKSLDMLDTECRSPKASESISILKKKHIQRTIEVRR